MFQRLRPKTFAPVLVWALVLWPIMAYMGAQGFTGSVAIAGILAIAYLRFDGIPAYAMIFVAFVLWVLVVSLWSPGGKPLLSGTFSAGTFTMDMVGARFGLTALAALSVMVATRAISPTGARISAAALPWVALIQGVGVLVTALLMQPIISIIVEHGLSSDPASMMQNLLRNANAYLLLLPILLVWAWHRLSPVLSIVIFVASLVAFFLTGTQSAMTGACLLLAAMAVVNLFPKTGFKVLFGALGAYILLTPAILAAGLSSLRQTGFPLPDSFVSRSYSWELVGQKILEKPFFGHGLEASQTWTDTYGDHPEWLAEIVARQGYDAAWQKAWSLYKVVPTHPHNMSLQVWAETGAVGAILAALAVVCLGWRLRPPGEWEPVSRYAAAGLVGAITALISFAYSMWNEAFWASVVLAAAFVLMQARQGDPG